MRLHIDIQIDPLLSHLSLKDQCDCVSSVLGQFSPLKKTEVTMDKVNVDQTFLPCVYNKSVAFYTRLCM